MSADRGPEEGPDAGFDVQGHRGALGYLPENSGAGFALAARLGATSVELDVRLSADGVPMVWHDPVLDLRRCRPPHPSLVGRRVDELTSQQLGEVLIGEHTREEHPGQRPAPGERMLSLRALFDQVTRVSPMMRFVVEVKVDQHDPRQRDRRAELVAATCAVIADCGVFDRSTVHSFDWAVLAQAADVAPHLRRSALASVRVDGCWFGDALGVAGAGAAPLPVRDLPSAARDAGAHVVCPYFALPYGGTSTAPGFELLANKDLADRCHALGLRIVPWTVDDPADLALVVQAGVDGVVTNYPDRARRVADALDRITPAAVGAT